MDRQTQTWGREARHGFLPSLATSSPYLAAQLLSWTILNQSTEYQRDLGRLSRDAKLRTEEKANPRVALTHRF